MQEGMPAPRAKCLYGARHGEYGACCGASVNMPRHVLHPEVPAKRQRGIDRAKMMVINAQEMVREYAALDVALNVHIHNVAVARLSSRAEVFQAPKS